MPKMRTLRPHIHKKLIFRLRLFLGIFIAMLIIIAYELAIGYSNIFTVLMTLLLSYGLGFLGARRMKIYWHAETSKVMKRMDTIGIFILIAYLAFSIARRTLLGYWFHGRELSVVLLSIAAGLTLGRFMGVRWRIKRVLVKEHIIPGTLKNNPMTIQRDNLVIDYLEKGTGDVTLLFVHGAFIDKTYWEAQIAHFSKNYHVVAMDLAGHGASGRDRTDWTMEEFGKDVVALIQTLELQKVILIGHSMGGDVILEAAVAHPEPIIGFIGIDNFKLAGTEFPAEIQAQIPAILQNLRNHFSDTSEAYARQALLTPETDAETTNRVIQSYRNAHPAMGVSSMESVFGYWQREQALLQRLPFKLYLIQCDYFPTKEASLQKYASSGYEITYIHTNSHYPMIERPEDFNRLLQQVVEVIVKEKVHP